MPNQRVTIEAAAISGRPMSRKALPRPKLSVATVKANPATPSGRPISAYPNSDQVRRLKGVSRIVAA